MKTESGSVLSSYVMGIILFGIGVFAEPLLMVLGGMIIITGTIARLAEARRLKYQVLEAEKNEANMKGQVA